MNCRIAIVLIYALLLLGCGWGAPGVPAPSDRELAKQALTQSLDAWQTNAKPESLKDSPTRVVISDTEWSNGTQLIRYEIAAEGEAFGGAFRFPVVLYQRDSRGAMSPKLTQYLVSTQPMITVTRNDPND